MRSVTARRRAAYAAGTLAAMIIGFLLIFPILYGIFGAFKTRAEFAAYPPSLLPASFGNLENFRQALSKAPLFRFMWNSLIVSVLGCTLRTLFATMAAYAFAYYDFRGKRFFFYLILGTMMLPADVLIITNYLTVSNLGLLDNYLGMCITSLVGASQMFMLRQNFKTIPKTFRDAAFIDGCGDLRYLVSIILPISRPVILTLMVQSFVTFWNAYLWPLLVTNKTEMRTVQVGITMLTTPVDTNYPLVLAAVTIVLIPSFLIFAVLRGNITKGITAGALVG